MAQSGWWPVAVTDPHPPMHDIGQLQQGHPGWFIGSVWASAGSGPEARRLVATRGGIQVHAWNAAELSRLIDHEEAANTWPGA